MQPVENEICWSLVAADGSVQFGVMSGEKSHVLELIDQYTCAGLGKPLPWLKREGFKIAQLRVTIELVGELEELKDVEL